MKNRIQRIFSNITTPPDVIFIKNDALPFIDENFFYITGLLKGIYEGSLAALYPDGTIKIVVPQLEEESAKKAGFPLYVYKDKKSYETTLKTEFSKAKNIGLNYTGLSHKGFQQLSTLFPKAQFTDVSNALVMTRQIKDNYELDQIQKACAITDKIMEKIPELLVEGIAEFEIAAEINYLMHKLGAEKPGFDTISSFNTNTAEPHYTQGSTRLKHGDFALFDIGACVQKYNSDITRTFVFGKATKRQKDMYSTVQAAQDIGFNEIRPGVQASDVHHAVSSFIDKTPYKGRFIHSTGHSLGILVHDGARLTTGSTLRLQENMVFTVEPGVYIPNFGGVRIEDDVMVTKKGVQLLTKVSRDFQEI